MDGISPTSTDRRVTTRDGVELHCTDRDGGPPVVFLASWSLPGASWTLQMDALCAAGLRCLTYDRRGHGRSPDPGWGYDFDTLAVNGGGILERLAE